MKKLIFLLFFIPLISCSNNEDSSASDKNLCLTCSQPLRFGGITSTTFCEGTQLSDGKIMTKEMIQTKSNGFVIMADGTECVCCSTD